MRATDFLVEQHRDVLELLDLLRDGTGEERLRLVGRLSDLLSLHAVLEQEHFYPLIRHNGFPEAAEASVLEHSEVAHLLARLQGVQVGDPEVELLLPQLDQMVREHLDKEEAELFPWANARIEQRELELAGERLMRSALEMQRRVRARRGEVGVGSESFAQP